MNGLPSTSDEGTQSSFAVLRNMIAPLKSWWQVHVLSTIDHREVVERVREDDGWTPRYAFMIIMSAGIAVLGLLQSSPAVVIGAMLISPLMGPIVGLGFALATVDAVEIRRTLSALAGGAAIAILFTAFIVLMSPLQTITAEIAARTRPNLFDFVVALFSALAGTYAMIRGKAGTIVGVAIATALMPPLATVGYGLATFNSKVFVGAFALFLTNFVTIAGSAAIMAKLYGFGRRLSPRQTMFQSVFIAIIFFGLAVPLGFSLRQIAWESQAQRQASDIISGQFPADSRISQIDIDFDSEPIIVGASILTKQYRSNAQEAAQQTLAKMLGSPVRLTLEQIRVSGGVDAQAAQLAAVQAKQAADQSQVERLTDRLSLVSGVAPEAITVDRDHHRAEVRAEVIPGAGLATYMALEKRAAQSLQGWDIEMIPPALPLPPIDIDDEGKATSTGARALALARWAAHRTGLPIAISGEADARDALIARLNEQGIDARTGEQSTAAGKLGLEWVSPALSAPPPQ